MAALGFFKPQDYASPEAIKNRRDLLDALTGRIGRAQNVGQGIGDMISGAVIGLSRGRLNRAEGEKTAGANKMWDAFNLFGRPQISPAGAQTAPQGVYEPQRQNASVRPSNAPSGDAATQIYQGLVQRGLPDHVAKAALGNMTVESRLNPGIHELAPLVKGSRGGFGLNQWTGPRRRAFEAFAAQKGVNPSDLGAQLDFTMQELKGPESRAFRKLMATKTPEEAAMVYSQSFLRPGIPHMNRRLEETRKYAGMDFGAPQQPVQVASNDQAFTPQPASFRPQAQAQTQPVPEQPMQAPQPDQSRINELMQLATNPWLDDGKKQMAQMMLQQEMQKQQQATDPMYQMNLQKAQQELQAGTLGMKKTQAELEQMQNPPPQRPIQVGGRLIDPVTFKPVYEPPESADARAKLGLNPQYGVDKNGNPVLLQIGDDGAAVQTQMPPGVTLSKEPIKLDAGTHFVLLDPITRQPVGQIPKNVAGEAAAAAAGKEQGAAQGQLPAARITADQTISKIDELLNDPNLGSVSGWQAWLPDSALAVTNGSSSLGLRRRVEQLKGSAFLEAYNGLRGGGQITEVEGKKAEDALARLDTAQSDADYVRALKDFRDAVEQGYAKLAAKASGTVLPPAVSGPSNESLEDLLKKYGG